MQPELLGVVALTRAIRDRDLSGYPLSQLFAAAGLATPVEGPTASWDVEITSRKTGKWNVLNGKAHTRQVGAIQKKYASLLTKYDKATLKESDLEGPFRKPGTEVIDAAGKAAIAKGQVRQAAEFDQARELAIAKAFQPGSQTFEFKIEGQSASQTFSIDFGHATTHYTEGALTGGLLGEVLANGEPAFGAWDTGATNILAQLAYMKRLIRKSTRTGSFLVLADAVAEAMLIRNDDVQALYGGSAGAQAAVENAKVNSANFLGCRWLWMDETYDNEAGADTVMWPTERVTMVPLPSRDWWEWLNGSYLVPGQRRDDPPTMRRGLSQWGRWTDGDPVGIDVFSKERYFPGLLRPASVVSLKANETATTPG